MHRSDGFYTAFQEPASTELPPIHKGSEVVKIPRLPLHPDDGPASGKGNGKDFFLLPPGKGIPKIVMDPLAVLRQCVRFFSCHPEIYGTNIRALLDREVMHVMRLQSSEVAIAHQQPVNSSHDMATAVEMISKPLLAAGGDEKDKKRKNKAKEADSLLGYGALTFMPLKQNFAVLLQQAGHAGGEARQHNAGDRRGNSSVMVGDETLDSSHNANAGTNDQEIQRQHLDVALQEMIQDATGNSSLLEENRPILVDAHGYEVSFLRRQLQQMEAAYNAKCIRLHELVEENTRLDAQLSASEQASAKWMGQYHEAHGHVEGLRRELEGWQEKAYKAELHGHSDNDGSQKNSKIRRRAASVMEHSKTEIERMTKLWRDTERNLQEAKRMLENSEREANDTHDHLSDAFMFIERLERRVARRDRFINIAARRQRSLEEKYEKLMWCLREVGGMTGAYSFVDQLLSDEPIWSLFVFSRLQRHAGDTYALDDALTVGPTAVSSLQFGRSNSGGRLLDDRYNTKLVYAMMADEVTGVTERRGRAKRLRTNLHGAVGCKVLRWENMFCLDFLGGEDSTPNSTEMNRRHLSLLTLASLTQPLRRQDGSRLDLPPPPAKKESQKGIGKSQDDDEEEVVIPEDNGAPNTRLYDQATVRLLIRNLWRERVAQFEATMRQRITKCITRARKTAQAQHYKNLDDILDNDDQSEDDDLEDSANIPNTFLGGLVNFVVNVCKKQAKQANPQEASPPVLLSVRGISSKDSNLWDDGRIFFASILDSKVRTATVLDGPLPEPPEITLQVREMICAMYFYTMEYKDMDADFRLFYLVSHQMVPECVGINFYACIEAIQLDCERMVQENLKPPDSDTLAEVIKKDALRRNNERSPFVFMTDEEGPSKELLSPLEAIAKTAELVDRTPIVQEDACIEVDTDDEGYGSILPGVKEGGQSTTEQPNTQRAMSPSVSEVSSPLSPTHRPGGSKEGNGTTPPNTVSAERSMEMSGTYRMQKNNLSMSSAMFEPKSLGHDILEYLDSIKHRRSKEQEKVYGERLELIQAEEERLKEPDPREPWEVLDDEIQQLFAPHERLSKQYRDEVFLGTSSAAMKGNRVRRILFDDLHRKSLAAARNLIPIEDILTLFHKHVFATYAITCCGAPRFFFPCAYGRETDSAKDYYQPFSRIGQMPPLPIHLKRLRTALALDQPSALINYKHLFSTDVNTFSPTHFYDEFLTLTLDQFAQQQNYMMNMVLTSCSSRHEQYSSEGAEECDGKVPISVLKKGFIEGLSELHISPDQAAALVEHLQHYHELLRLDNDVKLEQFTDAPFLFDTAPVEHNDDDDDDTEWQFQDEAIDCSLLFLSLAVRLIYPVWSSASATQAQRLMNVLETWTPVTKISQYVTRVPPLVRPQAPSTPFSKDAQEKYLIAAQHLAEGNSGNLNPMRVTARWIVEEERVREEAKKENSKPEAYEYHFDPPKSQQLHLGMFPNLDILRQLLAKAWKVSTMPDVSKPKKPKTTKIPGRKANITTAALAAKESEAAEEAAPAVETTPIRDLGLFVLSRAMGTSRSYALKGPQGKSKKSSKKAVALPFSVEMQLQLQNLHFQNSLAILQASRSLFTTFLRDIQLPAEEKAESPDNAGGGGGPTHRRGVVVVGAIEGEEQGKDSTLSWTPAFRRIEKHKGAGVYAMVSEHASDMPGRGKEREMEKEAQKEEKQLFVDDLMGCFAALSSVV